MKDKVVVITGAAGALGSAVARACLNAGASVALAERSADAPGGNPAGLDDARRVLHLPGVDVTDGGSLARMAAAAVSRFSRIDALLNLVGTYKGKALLDEDPATWDLLMDVNARSVFLASQAVVPYMRRQGRGKVVNVGSAAALAAFSGGGIYAASKAAVLRLTEALSAELKGDGINVNAVLPGTMDTPANRAAMPEADPLRWVTPEEVADVIVFLASDAARGIHGAAIPVYGRG